MVMKIYEFEYDDFPELDKDFVLCLGFFDGVHIGHQKIFEEAKKFGKKIAVLSFNTSTYNFLNNKEELLTPTDKKIEILDDLGIDYYFEINMSDALINASKEDFLAKLVLLHPYAVVCGPDYTFGHNKSGGISDLAKFFKTKVVDFENYEEEKISTKLICKYLENGKIFEANSMLGRKYSVKGRVVEGNHNGEGLGFPTANILLSDKYFMPKQGVYFGYATLYDEKYPAIASYGTHPTFPGLEEPILEVHILRFKNDIYGDILEFEFIHFVRENEKFYDTFDLMEKIQKDKLDAIEFFESKKN